MAKMFVTLLIVFTLKTFSCHFPSADASKLYFHLLKSDDLTADDTEYNYLSGRRPSPSDDLPVGDLLEDASDIYDPRPSDINTKSLRQQLGNEFDKEYMSIRDPTHRRSKKLIRLIRNRPKGRRPTFLNLFRTARLQDGRKLKLNVSSKNRKKFQKFLWSLTFCPVKRTWKNLGIRFWPQWIQEASCYSEHSCSVPPGMKCKPSGSASKTFLRWHCADFRERHFCRWIPIQYPVITDCSCGC